VEKILTDLAKEMALEGGDPQAMSFIMAPEALQILQDYNFHGNVRELENILERAMTLCEDNFIKEDDLQLLPSTAISSSILFTEGGSGKLDPLLDVLEKETIMNALEQTKGNKTKAAKLLGLSFGAFRYRLQKFKLDQK